MSVETGLPIMVQTRCRVGSHIFVWATSDRYDKDRPPRLAYCDCGLMVWPEDEEQPRERGGAA